MNNEISKLDYLFKQYDNLLFWHKHVQDLSKFLFAVNAVVIGIINGLFFLSDEKFSDKVSGNENQAKILVLLCALTMLISFLFLFRSIWAMHRKKPDNLRPSEEIWFFGHIAELSFSEFTSRIEDWSPDHALEALKSQIHIVSRHLKTRYDSINMGFTFTGISLLLLLAVGLV